MKACLLLFTILSIPAIGQILLGTVAKIDKDQLQVKGRDGTVTFRTDDKTVIAKLKKCNDVSVLAVGDEVRVNYYGEGTFTAVNVSAKVAVAGVITEGSANHVTVALDSAQADRKTVFVFLNTAGGKLTVNRAQLTVGRRVQVSGFDTGDGVIEADKVTFPDAGPARGTRERPQT
jgi:membrane-bound ClpP family serine protease